MCGSKGSTVSSTSGPPQAFLQAYQDVYNQARGLTGQPYQSYTGPMVAGFSPDQLAAFGTIQNSQGLAQPYYNQAASYFNTSALPISPMGFDNVDMLPGMGQAYFDYAGNLSAQAANYAAQATTPVDLMKYDISPYENAYTSDVTNALSDLYAQNNAQQFSQIAGNAGAQGAYGGDREAIAEAETAKQQKLAQDPTLAQVQQQGFQTAQQEFNTQQAADLQRQLAERQYLLGAAGSTLGAGQLGLGIGQGMWGEFNTQQAQNTQAQEASAWLQQASAQGLANLGQLSQNTALAGANAQLGVGSMEQQLAQQQLNVPYYQFMQQQAYPYQQLGWLSNIATGLGGASGGNASTTYPGPSTLGQIAGLGTAGLGVYGLGNQQGWWGGGSSGGGGFDSGFGGDFGGWSAADGGAIKRAPGGSVGLDVPPEFGGAGVPMGPQSYIPGASGLGSEPTSKGGSGLSKMFMQPVATQTQSGGGGGGLGSILSLGLKALPLFLDDGGAVPRGTGLAGYAGGGAPIHPAAPIVSDLTNVRAPSSYGPANPEAIMPAFNYSPSFDAQGYPGAMTTTPRGAPVPPPLSIPMVNGMLNRPAIGGPPAITAPSVPGLATAPTTTGNPFIDMGAGDVTGGGGASGGHVGLGGIGHYDDGGPVTPPVPFGMEDPATALAAKIKRIQDMESLRRNDNWPSFQNLLNRQPKADGGIAYPDMLRGYIPAYQGAAQGMGPPKPPTMPGWKPDQGLSSTSVLDMLKSVKSSGVLDRNESLGGAVEPSAVPLQYDDGGLVPAMMGGLGSSGMQERALLQQYQSLPTEKLRELAMMHPATTPQGAAIQRALQMRQMMPSYPGATGPAGPAGAAGQMQPGTAAARGGTMGLASGGYPWWDYVEPPPKRPDDSRAQRPVPPPRPHDPPPVYVVPMQGFAGGGMPEDVAYSDIPDQPLPPPLNDVSDVREADLGGLGLPPPKPLTLTRGLAAPQSTQAAGDLAMSPDIGEGLAPAPQAAPGAGGGLSDTEYRQKYPEGILGAPGGFSDQGQPSARPAPSRPASGDIDWQTAWPLIKHFESGDRNVMNYINDRTHTAGGYGQITNTNWRTIAPSLGIDLKQYPTAISAPEGLQEQVAHQLYVDDKSRGGDGFGAWAPYNPKLAAFLGSGKSLPPPDQVIRDGQGLAATPVSDTSAQGLAASPASYTPPARDTSPHTMRNIMSSPWMMLIGAGAGMLASRSPYPGVAIGEGLQTGLKVAQHGAEAENKEELAQVRQASSETQAKHFAEMALQAKTNAADLSAHRQANEAQAAANAGLRAQLADAATMRAQTAMASAASQAEAREIQNRLKQELADIKRDTVNTTISEGPDPNDPSKRVPGVWYTPKSPDPNDPTGGVRFFPGPSKAAVGEKGILDQMVKDGLAKDIGEAQRLRSEYKRDPNGFKNSTAYVTRVQAEEKALQQAWGADLNNIGKKPPDFRMQAQRKVEAMFGAAPAVTGAPGVPTAPAASAPIAAPSAPAGPPQGTIIGGYRFKGGNPNDRSNWEPVQ